MRMLSVRQVDPRPHYVLSHLRRGSASIGLSHLGNYSLDVLKAGRCGTSLSTLHDQRYNAPAYG